MSDEVVEKRKGRIINDAELLAMADVVDTLESLTEAQRLNVMAWMQRRYGPGPVRVCPDGSVE